MRFTQFKSASFKTQLFVSAKCAVAIPIGDMLTRDALIQASLDPAVTKIDYLPSANVGGQQVRLDAIVLHREGGKYHLKFGSTRPRDFDEEGLVLVAFSELGIATLKQSAEEILQDPGFSSARTIWQYSNTEISFHDRATIIAALENHGPLSIRELQKVVHVRRPLTTLVYALACEGSIEIDISERALSGRTVVRPGFSRQRKLGKVSDGVCPPISKEFA
jgi:hypothetical protein